MTPTVAYILLVVLVLIALCLLLCRSRGRGYSVSHIVATPPYIPEVDTDHSPELIPKIVQGEEPYWLVLDTEGIEAIDELNPSATSAPLAISWQVLSRQGDCLREESFILSYPNIGIDEKAIAIHGIDIDRMTRHGQKPEQVYWVLKRDLSACTYIVAHNLPYHLDSLVRGLADVGLPYMWLYVPKQLCTMSLGRQMAFKLNRYNMPTYPKLSELFGYLRFGRLYVQIQFESKTLRDVRLLSASMRLLIGAVYLPKNL